jgi:hypothetical protein
MMERGGAEVKKPAAPQISFTPAEEPRDRTVLDLVEARRADLQAVGHSTMSLSPGPRPKVSGEYISSALGGGTTKMPGVVARAT